VFSCSFLLNVLYKYLFLCMFPINWGYQCPFYFILFFFLFRHHPGLGLLCISRVSFLISCLFYVWQVMVVEGVNGLTWRKANFKKAIRFYVLVRVL